MPFIGQEPLTGAYHVLDSITASATATYNLQLNSAAFSPATANQLLVSLNGVIQKPGSSFTISGSQITFSSALTSSDSIDFIIALGDVLNVGTPTDGSVATAKIAPSAVTDAKIASGITATKLTGTIDVARVPAGTAIQVVNSANGTNYNVNSPGNANATTTTEFPNYHVTITPLRTGSRFKVDGKVSSVGFANTGSGQGAIYSRVAYSIAGATKVFAGIDTGHYGNNNTYSNHVLSGLTGALSYTLGQSIQFQVWGYGQYFSAGQYAWNRVGGGSGLTITEIAQ